MAGVRKLLVQILGDSRSVERAFLRSERAAKGFGREMDVASTKFSRFGSVAKGAVAGAGGVLAFQQLANGIRIVTQAAADSEQALVQTQAALRAAGFSWEDYGTSIDRAIQAQSQFGFDDEELLTTFSLFVRRSRDINEALRENNIAMNVARARFISLGAAAAIVNKAALGQAGALRRIGIETGNATDGMELLALLETQFAGSAEAASNSATGAMNRYSVAIENVQESVGTLLLPVVVELADALSDAAVATQLTVEWLGKLGSLRIPTIEIPIVSVSLGGDRVANIGRDIGREFLESLPHVGPIIELRNRARAARGRPGPDVKAAADTFARAVPGFLETIQREVTKKVTRGAAPAFGQPGFKPLKPTPLITAISARLEGALLDAQTTEGMADDLRVLDQQQKELIKALNQVGLTTEQTNAIKRALAGVKTNIRQIKDTTAEAAENARQAGIDKALGKLGLQVDRAGLTAGLRDDLAALNQLANALRILISKGGEVARYEDQLIAVLGAIGAKQDELRATAAAATQARQFRMLGLTGTGEKPLPGLENLAKQMQSLSKRISGTPLEKKYAGMLKRIGSVLKLGTKEVSDETKRAILEMFEEIRGAFEEGGKSFTKTATSQLNANKVLAGIGLDPAEVEKLRGRLSHFNTAGQTLAPKTRATAFGAVVGAVAPVTVENTIILDGAVIGRSTKRFLASDSIHSPRQKRGPNAGRQ